MSVTQRDPNTIWLGGPQPTLVTGGGGELFVASEVIYPGANIELFSDSGTPKWRNQASATELSPRIIALEQIEFNKGINDTYAVGDGVKAAILVPGAVFWGFANSGQNIQTCERLQPAGDGSFKVATATTADANLAHYQSLSEIGAITTKTGLRIQVVS